MAESSAIYFIRSLQKKWTVNTVLSYSLLSMAFTLLLSTVLIRFFQVPWWWSIPVFIVCFAALLFIYSSWKVSEINMAMFLNQQFPQLEESSGLLLKPSETLNLLEKLQVKKVEQVIAQLKTPPSFYRKLIRSALVLLAVMAVSSALYFVPVHHASSRGSVSSNKTMAGALPEKILPNVSSIQVTVRPPAYTGKDSRTQNLFNVKAEEGADVRWQIKTTVPAESLQLLINGTTVVPLSSTNGNKHLWSVEKNIRSSGFYQLKIDGRLSELYTLEMIKDAPPVIIMRKPAAYTVVDYGQPQQITMSVSIEDDYGIREASVSATTTSGSGEGVKFKEQKLPFTNFSGGARRYDLQKLLDLPALGVKPGDELYFYVRSVDNFNQESRSEVYMISIPDTAQLMSIDGLASGVDIKPEYFRSERQIIIETEQLLKDQKTIPAEAFKNKSNDLGIDQKLLRLRYSKFLGDESEGDTEAGHAEDNAPGDNDPADFNNAQKVMDQVSHEKDGGEDASFFESSNTKQLRVILDEMWKAETRLRTLKPADALPYEYKALRLLKDLQEKGRSYVAKTSVKTTPLKPEKRLSGDLSKIGEPVNKADFEKKETPEDNIRRALGILENLKAGTGPDKASSEILQQAGLQLNRRAAAEPALYLTSLGAMNRIVASGNASLYSATDITAVQKGLRKLVNAPAALPAPDAKNPDQSLSQQYFNNLKRLNR